MFDLLLPTTSFTEHVQLPASATSIEVFQLLLYTPRPVQPPLAFHTARDLWELVNTFDCGSIRELCRVEFTNASKRGPLELLQYGSEKNDVVAAKEALWMAENTGKDATGPAGVAGGGVLGAPKKMVELLKAVRPDFRVAVMRSLMP